MSGSHAAELELRKRYREAYRRVLELQTTLVQIVSEDFPDPDAADCRPTRYQVDALNGLAASLSALVEGHERG